MARPSNLNSMSLKELLTLQTRVEQAIAEKRISEKADLKAKLAKLAADSGFDLAELMDGRRKGGKVAPKYRNPDDASQTWTGRGRRPLWIVAAMKKGVKLEKLAI